MSCLLDEIGIIKDVNEILPWLCPHITGRKEVDHAQLWDDELRRTIDNQNKLNNSNDQENISWLDECHVAISPFMDIMVLACKNRIAFFTGRWERINKTTKKDFFSNSWHGIVGHNTNDEVTSILCLPIISQKQSSSGAPDWTCIIVGYRSGYVSFYTENGLVLLSQIFEDQCVYRISCRTYIPNSYGSCVYSDLTEELTILYPKAIVTINGFSLLQSLKACRNQAAKAAASGEESQVKSVTFDYKKFGVNDQDIVSDCAASGLLPPHLYDHIIYESSVKGFTTSVSSGVPSTNQIITVGKSPFFGILGIREGSMQPFIADIAMHYASKLKNAIFEAASGWLPVFGGNRYVTEDSSSTQRKPKIEQALPVSFRYALPDQRRLGSSISLSLSRRLAAITDDFGRVSIIDIQKCNVIRILKGYRDAECGWITVNGEWNKQDREVSFLVIHAPKRSILEVWMPQQGPRIAAFNVLKDSRLVYTSHTYLGANTKRDRSIHSMSVILLNQNGTMNRLSIPFHLALCGKTSKQSKDLHLLKTLRHCLRYESLDQVLKILKEIQTTNVKLQVLNQVISSRHVTVSLMEGILTLYQISEDIFRQDNMDHECRILIQQLNRLSRLTGFYKAMKSTVFDSSSSLSHSQILKKMSHHLMLSEDDTSQFIELIEDMDIQSNNLKQVSFILDKMTYSSFLQCWDITTFDREASSIISTNLHKKIVDEKKIMLGYLIYGWVFNPAVFEYWLEAVFDSGLRPKELLQLAFGYWLQLTSISSIDVVHMAVIMLTLTIMDQPLNLCHPSLLNPYWEHVRAQVNEWCKPLHSYIIVCICRGIEYIFILFSSLPSNESTKQDLNQSKLIMKMVELVEKNILNTDYEQLSMEMVEWNLLLSRSIQLLSLQKVYNSITRTGVKIQPDYSVRIMISKGKGHVSGLIARWLIELEIDPNNLLLLIQSLELENEIETANQEQINLGESISKHSFHDEKLQKIRECLTGVQMSFPNSMIQDIIKLNISWEFGAAWKKSPTKIDKLEASVLFLTNIENPYCKHGIGCLLWENLIQNQIQKCVKIMERHRGPPVASSNSPELSSNILPRLFNTTKELLESIINGEASISYKAMNKLALETDEFWRDVRGTLPLAEIAIAQQITSSDLTYIHHQLLCVLSLIVLHNITAFRPVSLFPERDRASFFKPLNTSWKCTSEEARKVVNCHQLNFLNCVITCIVVSLPDLSADESNNRLLEPSSVIDCVNLGRSWGVAIDALRRHYICELYSSGLDPMADYGLMKVNDAVMMASQMVLVGGQRLRYLMTSHNNALLVIPFVMPSLKDWCMALDSNALRCPDAPIQLTVAMVFRATNFLRETSRDYKLAHRLLNALKMIKESDILHKGS